MLLYLRKQTNKQACIYMYINTCIYVHINVTHLPEISYTHLIVALFLMRENFISSWFRKEEKSLGHALKFQL